MRGGTSHGTEGRSARVLYPRFRKTSVSRYLKNVRGGEEHTVRIRNVRGDLMSSGVVLHDANQKRLRRAWGALMAGNVNWHKC